MSKMSIYVATALLTLPVFVSVVLFFRVPLDPHYGMFPKFIAATLGLVAILPGSIWVAVAGLRSDAGKALLAILVCTVIGFVVLNIVIGEFGGKVLSFPLLAGGLVASLSLTLFMLCRGWRGLRHKAKIPNQPPHPTRG